MPKHLLKVDVTVEHIRRLMEFQGGCCAITGLELYTLDKDIDDVGFRSTESMAKAFALTASQRNRVPVIERIDFDKPFVLGNLLIIAAVAAPLYRELGGIGRWISGARVRELRVCVNQAVELYETVKGEL